MAGQVSSPVALSEQKPFRRKFESVYDGLENGEMDIGEILSLLPDCVPEDSETIAGYKVYAVDATPNEHEEAETLPDRSVLKSNQSEPLRYGHKYSWVARLICGTSWAAPVDVERIIPRVRIRSWQQCKYRNWISGISKRKSSWRTAGTKTASF